MSYQSCLSDIYECALSWTADDNDDERPVPEGWQETLTLAKAAPAMLAALERVVPVLRLHLGTHTTMGEVQAAIAAAKGEGDHDA